MLCAVALALGGESEGESGGWMETKQKALAFRDSRSRVTARAPDYWESFSFLSSFQPQNSLSYIIQKK